MLVTIQGRWVRRAALGAACLATVLSTSTSCALVPSPTRSASYCALFPDTVGLYVGNPVTQMGLKIGTVDTITPTNADVRVDFTVTEQRRLPGDVKAIIRSTSLLADRAVELVGNYESGLPLGEGQCIPLSRSSTPKSISDVIGSTAQFFNAITPDGSTNLADVMRGVDQLTHNNGPGIRDLLTKSSGILDNPDQVIADLGSAVTNLATLTGTIDEMRAPLKSAINDAVQTTSDLANTIDGASRFITPVWMLVQAVEDIEMRLGDFTQLTLDILTASIRKIAPHANALAHTFDVVPWWINSLANRANNHQFNYLSYRPPMWRIATPDGWALCGFMNANSPGSCANVGGQPYAADVSLLQYVFMKAASR